MSNQIAEYAASAAATLEAVGAIRNYAPVSQAANDLAHRACLGANDAIQATDYDWHLACAYADEAADLLLQALRAEAAMTNSNPNAVVKIAEAYGDLARAAHQRG